MTVSDDSDDDSDDDDSDDDDRVTVSDAGGAGGQTAEDGSGPVPGGGQLGLLGADAESLHQVCCDCHCPCEGDPALHHQADMKNVVLTRCRCA